MDVNAAQAANSSSDFVSLRLQCATVDQLLMITPGAQALQVSITTATARAPAHNDFTGCSRTHKTRVLYAGEMKETASWCSR
jgi:hypothetical protein